MATGETDNKTKLRELSELLKAMSDETRLAILVMLQEGELCVCEIMDQLSLSQPAVSHHLKILRQAGLISDRREGKWIYYSLDAAVLKGVQQLLQQLLITPLNDGSCCRTDRPHPRCRRD